MENLTPVTLVIKAPNQKIADQTIECALDWTVKKLKQHLSSVYPSKPTETQQRIIYSGQLLQDHLKLKDILRQYEPNQQTHTVHLVCSPSTTDFMPSSQQQQQSTPKPSPAEGSSSYTAEGLRHRHPTTTSLDHQSQSSPSIASPAYGALNIGVPPNPLGYPPAMSAMGMLPGAGFPMMAYNAEQLMWMQQYYTQYMTQYMSQYSQQQGIYQPQPGQPEVAAATPPQNPARMEPEQAVPAAAARPARQQPEVVRMNAQGGPVVDDDDDDMPNRDWLDWVYTFIRFGILLCILYFYSTIGRFVATMGLVFILYMYQVGWFRVHRRNQRQPHVVVQPVQQNEPQPPVDDDHNVAQQANDAQNEPNAATGANDNNIVRAEPAAPGALSLAWTFFVTFFSSLAPQQPPPVNVN
jgi:hypothetical protein